MCVWGGGVDDDTGGAAVAAHGVLDVCGIEHDGSLE